MWNHFYVYKGGLINHLKTKGPHLSKKRCSESTWTAALVSEIFEGKWMNTWEFWVRSLKLKLIRLLWYTSEYVNTLVHKWKLEANHMKRKTHKQLHSCFSCQVFFRNLASRPYSLHSNGVKYLKQMEGLSYDDQSPYWYKQDDAVQPNSTFVYIWTINSKSGPQNNESDCRTWTYYSAVNPVSMNAFSFST